MSRAERRARRRQQARRSRHGAPPVLQVKVRKRTEALAQLRAWRAELLARGEPLRRWAGMFYAEGGTVQVTLAPRSFFRRHCERDPQILSWLAEDDPPDALRYLEDMFRPRSHLLRDSSNG